MYKGVKSKKIFGIDFTYIQLELLDKNLMSLDGEIIGGIVDEAKVAIRSEEEVKTFDCSGYFAPFWVWGQEVESLGRFEVIGDTGEGAVGVKITVSFMKGI